MLELATALDSKRYWDGTKFRTVFLFRCSKCDKDIWKRSGQLKTSTGLCRNCAAARPNIRIQLRPFEWVYKRLLRSAKIRSIPVLLSYEGFVGFTTVEECYYCGEGIHWNPFNQNKSSRGTNLDRKDNNRGYEEGNLVVACKVCNRIKNETLSYSEMVSLGTHLRAIRLSREGQKW